MAKEMKLGSKSNQPSLERELAKRGGAANPQATGALIGRRGNAEKQMPHLSGSGRRRS